MFMIHGQMADHTHNKALNPPTKITPERYGQGAYGAIAGTRLMNTDVELPLSVRYTAEDHFENFKPGKTPDAAKMNLLAFTHTLMEAVAGGPVLGGLNGNQTAKFVTALLDQAPPVHQTFAEQQKKQTSAKIGALEKESQQLIEASIEAVDQNEDGLYDLKELSTFVHWADGIHHNLMKGDEEYIMGEGPMQVSEDLDEEARKMAKELTKGIPGAQPGKDYYPIDLDTDQDGKISCFERRLALDYIINSEDGFGLFNRLSDIKKDLNLDKLAAKFLTKHRVGLN